MCPPHPFNSYRVALTLALDQGSVAAVEIQLVHLGLVQADNRVVIVGGVLHNEAVRLGLGPQNGRGRVVVGGGSAGRRGGNGEMEEEGGEKQASTSGAQAKDKPTEP